MNDFVFKAIAAMQKNGYGDPCNFDKYVGRCCDIKGDRVGFVVMTKQSLWKEVRKEVKSILAKECPEIRIKVIEQDNNKFFVGDLYVELEEV